MASGNIYDLFAGYKGLKADWKDDWIENTRDDWKVDWATVPVTLPPGHVAIANTVAPVITGTGAPGQTLTLVPGTWVGTPAPSFTYQWYSSYSGQLTGQTGLTYVVQNSDVFSGIYAKVTASNVDSTVVAQSSNMVAILATLAAPANTVLPHIFGNALIDSMLTVNVGTWTGYPSPIFTYQWNSSLASIATLGAVTPGSGYTEGFYSDVTLTGGSGTGAVGQVQVDLAGNVTTVTISAGNGYSGAGYLAGDVLSFAASQVGGTGSGASVLVATVTNAISHATDKVYLTQLVDATATITCVVTATNVLNGVYTSVSATSTGFGPILLAQTAPANTVAVTITGTAVVGDILTAVPGTWTGVPTPNLTYQWLSAGVPIQVGELVEVDGSDPYVTTFVETYAGAILTGVIYNGGTGYSNGTHTGVALTGGDGANALATITVAGGIVTAVTVTTTGDDYGVDNYLSASTIGAGTGFSYRVNTVSVAGGLTENVTSYIPVMATGLTYTVQDTDVGNAIQVVETGANVAGSAAVTSVATAVVPVVPVSSLTAPVISGTGAIGTLLSSTAGTWAGQPPPSFTFQWYSGATPVTGESGPVINLTNAADDTSTYEVQGTDFGNNMTCKVTATNTSNITASSYTAPGGNPGVDLKTGTYTNVPLYNGSGKGAVATVVVGAGGLVTSITITNEGTGYAIGDELSALQQYVGGVGYPFTLIVTAVGTPVTATSNIIVAS